MLSAGDAISPAPHIWRLSITPMSTRNLAVVALIALALGAVFRVVDIDHKFFWFNEVFTGLRLSCEFETAGHFPELRGAGPVSPSTLVSYQTPSPDDGYFCIIQSLAAKDRMNPPLYYLTARLWTDALGFSTMNLRLFSAILGLAVIGAAALLSHQLFLNHRVAFATAALVALSPIFIRYAQEARSYTLWLLLALFAASAFLRALGSGRRRDWWLCFALLTAALWTHLLTISILMSFALFLVLRDGVRWTPDAKRFTLVASGSLIAISPWLANIVPHLLRGKSNLSHLSSETDPAFLLDGFGRNLMHILLSWPDGWPAWGVWALLPLGTLLGLAFMRLWRVGPRPAFLFLITLIVPGLVLVLLPDLVLGGQRSLRARYFFPLLLALLLALAHMAAAPPGRRWWATWIAPVLVLAGATSSWHAVQSPTWWGLSAVDLKLLDVIAGEPNSLIVTDAVYGVVAPLGHSLDSETAFLLGSASEFTGLPDGFSRYLLYQPGPELFDAVAKISEQPPKLIFEMARVDGKVYRLFSVVPGGGS